MAVVVATVAGMAKVAGLALAAAVALVAARAEPHTMRQANGLPFLCPHQMPDKEKPAMGARA